MANETDPLARALHGTNPQNLLEYITRQKIYDSRFWKEECFGLAAVDVAQKAATRLQAAGGAYGGHSKPTRFLSLVLKLLQIQPDDEIVDELIANEDFKYVRALGAFYLRMTGRPADIYEKLEPLYHDYRKIRLRGPTEWSLIYMDEYIDELLTKNRVFGIALPRLPKRETLEEAGYLDGPRKSALLSVISDASGAEAALKQLAQDGSEVAKLALEKRQKEKEKKLKRIRPLFESSSSPEANKKPPANADIYGPGESALEGYSGDLKSREDSYKQYVDRERYADHGHSNGHGDGKDQSEGLRRHEGSQDEKKNRSKKRHSRDDDRERKRSRKEKSKKEKSYGTLFKSIRKKDEGSSSAEKQPTSSEPAQDSEEYWNEQREKLGLKPLRK